MDVTIIFVIVFAIIAVFVAASYYRLSRPETRKYIPVDWDAIHDPQVQDLMAQKQKIEAIKRYRELSRDSLKAANDAIEYLIAHPNAVIEKTKGSYYTADIGQKPSAQDISAALDDPQIHDLVRQGKKIEAIKRFRKLTDVGLKEAKDAVESIERGQQSAPLGSLAAISQTSAPIGVVDEPHILDLLRQGKKIDAIKAYREMTGAGLKDAKDIVEAMERKMMF